jgi:thiamine kinase-like enzyme
MKIFQNSKKLNWRIHLSGRGSRYASNSEIDAFTKSTLPIIKDLIESRQDLSSPPFPGLWYSERLARDVLRNRFRDINLTYNLWAVVQELNASIRKSLQDKLGNNETHIGIYLKDRDGWKLYGSQLLLKRRPEYVPSADPATKVDSLNAFDWVGRAVRPVLIRPDAAPQWINRFEKCGREFALGFREINPEFAGACIVPITDLHKSNVSIGLVTMISHGVCRISPAHVFLLNRLTLEVAGYLEPFNPFPGYSQWPQAVPSRGKATTVWSPIVTPSSKPEGMTRIVTRFAEELMPADSSVTIFSLEGGQGGAEVFRLGVKDKEGNAEVYRVLKVGPADLIASELELYHRYVHNKGVGGASRLDIAKTINDSEREWGGIVYIFVGAGEAAEPWSKWAITAAHSEIERGLRKLFEQLGCWYSNSTPSSRTAIDLLIEEPYLDALPKTDNFVESLSAPTFAEVKHFIENLRGMKNRSLRRDTPTVVVHGDLHAGNLFSVFDDSDEEGRGINNVAVIDWGNVRPGSHPLSDITKLVADLMYKVRWDPDADRLNEEKVWSFTVLRQWCARMHCQSEDHWKLAFVHQVSKMLFYCSGSGEDRRMYFCAGARAAAWEDLQHLADELRQSG